jgi:hypothetical protein
VKIYFLFFCFFIWQSIFAQNIYETDTLHNDDLKNNSISKSLAATRFEDFYFNNDSTWLNKFRLRRLQVEMRFSNNRPFGNTDGSLMQVPGFQALFNLQFSYVKKRFGFILSPLFLYSKSTGTTGNTTWGNSLNFIKGALASEGTTFFLNLRKIQLGLSDARFILGPTFIEHLLLGNNAPGFQHAYIRTSKPILVGIGNLLFDLSAGKLLPAYDKNPYENVFGLKSYIPPIHRAQYMKRYYNSISLAINPIIFPNSYFGIIRQFQLPLKEMNEESNFVIRYLPIFQNIAKSSLGGSLEDSVARDQQLSIFYSLVIPSIRSRFSIEYGWNDHKWNLRDLFVAWPHSAAYIISFKRLGNFGRMKSDLVIEYVRMKQHLEQSLRDAGDWYTFHGRSVGPTHRGQILGVGGSNGLGTNKLYLIYRVSNEKVVHGIKYIILKNNHTYQRSRPYIWTDQVISFSSILKKKYYMIRSELVYVHARNYGLVSGNKTSFQLNFGVVLHNVR